VRWLAIVGVLSGCHLAFGLERDDDVPPIEAGVDAPPDAPPIDRDGDGIDDSVDTCIVSMEDDTANDDGDGLSNAEDPCPFNGSPSGDGDNDGIPDACDPFGSSVGDHHLCVMTFAKTQLAAELWLPRAPDKTWAANPGQLRAIPGVNEIATVIAATSLEGMNVTTYQATVDFNPRNSGGGITLWLRANPAGPSESDVGCHFEPSTMPGTADVSVLGPGGPKDKKQLLYAQNAANPLRIQGSLATTGADVLATCRFSLNGTNMTSTGMVPLVPGRMGFTTDRWDTAVNALYVMDRL
jgi:hypothetical protein